jgi:hypothetical protein
MDSPKTTNRIIAKIWKPFAWLAALTLLLGLAYLAYTLYGLVSHPAVSTRQVRTAIQQAGHGKVDFVQDNRVDGILAAQVRYPNHSLHTVFFLTHDGKIRGIVVGGHVYTNQGKPWAVVWPGITFLPIPPGPAPASAAPAISSIPNPAAQAQTMQKTVGTGLAAGRLANGRSVNAPKTILRYTAFAHGFVWGRDDHTPIDVLVDPNCLYCHKWFISEKAAVNAGKISFRIIPVAALKPSSVPRAIEIMSAKNPLSLWLQNENGFHTKTESGGISTKLAQNKAMGKAVAVNSAILYAVDNHHPLTPTFIDNRTGQVWMGANHDQELAHALVQK